MKKSIEELKSIMSCADAYCYTEFDGTEDGELYTIKSHSLWQKEFADILRVLEFGAKKHGKDNYLENNGNKASHTQQHDSMFHHLAESYSGSTADKESGLHPLLHLATRALMQYTRYKRGLIHPKDNKEE